MLLDLAAALPAGIVQEVGFSDLIAHGDDRVQGIFRILHDQTDPPAADMGHLLFAGGKQVQIVEGEPIGGDARRLRKELHECAPGHRLSGT